MDPKKPGELRQKYIKNPPDQIQRFGFDPFSGENASQVDTKARFGKQAFARKSDSHPGKYL